MLLNTRGMQMLGSFGLGSDFDSCFDSLLIFGSLISTAATELFAELFDAIVVLLDTALN